MLHRPTVSKKEPSRIPGKWIPQIEIKRKGCREAATIPIICSPVTSHTCRGLQGPPQPRGPPLTLNSPCSTWGWMCWHIAILWYTSGDRSLVSPPLPPLRKSFPILLYNESIFIPSGHLPNMKPVPHHKGSRLLIKTLNFLLFEARRWLMKKRACEAEGRSTAARVDVLSSYWWQPTSPHCIKWGPYKTRVQQWSPLQPGHIAPTPAARQQDISPAWALHCRLLASPCQRWAFAKRADTKPISNECWPQTNRKTDHLLWFLNILVLLSEPGSIEKGSWAMDKSSLVREWDFLKKNQQKLQFFAFPS